MITEERKAELRSLFTSSIERYLDKQWVADETMQYLAEDKEELDYLRAGMSWWVTAQ